MERSIAEYFFRARDIVARKNPNNVSLIQFFQKRESAVLAGMAEVIELLSTKLKGTGTILRYLPEGSLIKGREVVLEIEGRYQDFCVYEGIVDGILSRATSIATNSMLCIEAARGKDVISMSDRSDHYSNYVRDGEAMYIGGIRSFSCYAHVPNGREGECFVYGSIPHAVIQNFSGDVCVVMQHYSEMFPDEDAIALVDFHNDVIGDSLKVLRQLGDKLKGVRVDTSGNMKDFMFGDDEKEYGVTPNQIKNLRQALDREPYGKNVKIFVSSGFDPDKIALFEREMAPVDGYGVGEFLLRINNTFCADAVKINGVELAKYGRGYRPNGSLKACQL